MIVNIRTRDDLRVLLRNRASGNWNIGRATEPQITKVRVFNWDTDQVLKGDFAPTRSIRDIDGDLIIGISKCRIENFKSKEKWFDIFGTAVVVYTPPVSIQMPNGKKTGIFRDVNFGGMNQNEIDDFFRRLIMEIRLSGLSQIVFNAGGIPIPDFFTQWCQENNVEIEVLTKENLENNYPEENDIVWEDDFFDDDQIKI
jgi:hypothetical protein